MRRLLRGVDGGPLDVFISVEFVYNKGLRAIILGAMIIRAGRAGCERLVRPDS